MKFFAELGALIEQRWRAQNYNEAAFPALAAQALHELPPHKHVDAWDILRWVFATTELPSQQDLPAKFGNPPITLYSGPRFHIDVYFWLDGTTSIHQHSFCGAFHVLMGSSIHSQYTFHPQQFLNEHFAVGEMSLDSVELLEQGQTQQILSGKEYIHSLFHLERPSATICVRTYHTTTESPQYNYLKPHFANDPFYSDPLTVKQFQSASLLLNMPHPQAVEMIDELLATADFQATFKLLDLVKGHLTTNRLEQVFGLTTGQEQYEKLWATARRRHGALVDLIPPVFEEARRQNNLIHRRGQITAPAHRFFLALLLNVPDRVRLLAMVQQKFPDRAPLETVLEWVEELATTKVFGSSEPNVLGIAEFDEDYLFVLRCLFDGHSLPETQALFAAEFGEPPAKELAAHITRLYPSIATSDLFKALFADLTQASQSLAVTEAVVV